MAHFNLLNLRSCDSVARNAAVFMKIEPPFAGSHERVTHSGATPKLAGNGEDDVEMVRPHGIQTHHGLREGYASSLGETVVY